MIYITFRIIFTYFGIDSISKRLIKSPMISVLDRLFLMKITVLHQSFDVRIKPTNRRSFNIYILYSVKRIIAELGGLYHVPTGKDLL